MDLIDWPFNFMHPTGNSIAMMEGEDDLDSSADEGENPQQAHANPQ